MFEQVGEFSYSWTVVGECCPSVVFFSFFGLFLAVFGVVLSVQLK